jgi:hypothetical protein
MMLLLALCCAGCAIARPRLQPSVTAGPMGNAILATLPAGTILQVPDPSQAAQLQAVFHGYLTTGNQLQTLQLVHPLKVATPSYLAERDAAEMELHHLIETLRANP